MNTFVHAYICMITVRCECDLNMSISVASIMRLFLPDERNWILSTDHKMQDIPAMFEFQFCQLKYTMCVIAVAPFTNMV